MIGRIQFARLASSETITAARIIPLVIELLVLTTLPASLRLTITRAEAWNVVGCRTDPLT